ncbi:MAG: hypothetical protein E7D51_04185 [Enterococcus faecalis]|nr:hypothetical protein [Enterococcus faecalis]
MLHDTYPVEVVEIGATRSVASVPAVYQFLSLGQKSKVIFVPGSFFIFFFHQKKTQQYNLFRYD